MLISLIDNAKFIISNDTGPAHIAMWAGPVSLDIINLALSINDINILIFMGSPSLRTTFLDNDFASLISSGPGAIKIE